MTCTIFEIYRVIFLNLENSITFINICKILTIRKMFFLETYNFTLVELGKKFIYYDNWFLDTIVVIKAHCQGKTILGKLFFHKYEMYRRTL